MSLKKFLTSNVFFKQLGIAIAIIIVALFLILKWISFSTNHGQEIPVPELRKLTVEKAGEKLEELDLDYLVLDTVDFRPEFPPFTIVEQDPLPNVTVKEDRKIYIKVNAGSYSTVKVPDLIQKTYRQVVLNLKAAGLEEGTKTYKPYLAKDVVLEMKQNGKILKPGDKVMKASKIDLVLGDGSTGFDDSELDSVQDRNVDAPVDVEMNEGGE